MTSQDAIAHEASNLVLYFKFLMYKDRYLVFSESYDGRMGVHLMRFTPASLSSDQGTNWGMELTADVEKAGYASRMGAQHQRRA